MASAGASAAAAAALQQMYEEEQEMTHYTGDDLNGWEFKILRSSTGAFNSPVEMNKALQEEAAHGWELVEKFDNYRMRLKRRIEQRKRVNSALATDAYRTNYGMSDGRLAVYVVVGVLVGTLLLVGVIINFVG